MVHSHPPHDRVEPGHRAAPTRTGARGTLLLAALLVLALPFSLLLALVEVGWEPLREVDRGVAAGLNELLVERDGVVFATQLLTDLGGGATWWVLLSVATAYLLVRRQPGLALFVAVTGLGGALLNRAVKAAVGRARPELAEPLSQAGGFAFPSGHTMSSAIGVTVLLIVFLPLLAARWRRPAVVAGALFAIAVGLSRIVLGVHWVSDVLGGWLLSAVWLLVMTALFRPWNAEPLHRQLRSLPARRGARIDDLGVGDPPPSGRARSEDARPVRAARGPRRPLRPDTESGPRRTPRSTTTRATAFGRGWRS